MRLLIILFLLSQSIITVAQKTYPIDHVSWIYNKPEKYNIKADNFSSLAKSGDSILKKNNNIERRPVEDNILFSFCKNDSVKMNIILADVKNNSNIERFTLTGYGNKLADFLRSNYAKLDADAVVTTTEVTIDKIRFFKVETVIHYKKNDYTYWADMYIAALSNKELNISVVYDNETDKRIITNSILDSKFVND